MDVPRDIGARVWEIDAHALVDDGAFNDKALLTAAQAIVETGAITDVPPPRAGGGGGGGRGSLPPGDFFTGSEIAGGGPLIEKGAPSGTSPRRGCGGGAAARSGPPGPRGRERESSWPRGPCAAG